TCTTQAPHWDVSQPTCVPVSRRFSRRNCTRSVRGSTSPVTALPFTVSATADMTFLLEIRPKTSFFAPTGETGGGSGQNRVDMANFSNRKDLDWQPAPAGSLAQQLFPAVANRATVTAPCTRPTPRPCQRRKRQFLRRQLHFRDERLARFRRCCRFRSFHLAFWLLLSFAREVVRRRAGDWPRPAGRPVMAN